MSILTNCEDCKNFKCKNDSEVYGFCELKNTGVNSFMTSCEKFESKEEKSGEEDT